MYKMKRILINGLITITIMFGLVSTAYADSALELIKDIEVHGFASSSYSQNFANPTGTRQNALRVYDFDANTFKFDVAELVLKKDATEKGDVGFRTDITYGFSGPQANKVGGPNVGGVDVSDDDFDLQIAYVQYNAPIGNGLLIDVGKFGTNIGSEVMDGYDGYNYTFSRSFLFFLGPFTHNGVRVQYQLSDTVGLLGILSNGHDTTTDTNDAKGIGGQISWAVCESAVVYLNYFGTAEPQNNLTNSDDFRNYFDTVIEVSLSKKLLLNLNAVYGTEDNATGINTGDHTWWGVSGIARYDVNNWLSLNYRAQVFHDQDGSRSGSRQKLWAMSLTPEVRINSNMVVRAEYRHDESDHFVFANEDGAGQSSTQDTLAFNALFYF
ncbi:MAG: hypothetical protein ACI8PD_000880 [Nitrospinales bacterium]|jgi:hypothetical protein